MAIFTDLPYELRATIFEFYSSDLFDKSVSTKECPRKIAHGIKQEALFRVSLQTAKEACEAAKKVLDRLERQAKLSHSPVSRESEGILMYLSSGVSDVAVCISFLDLGRSSEDFDQAMASFQSVTQEATEATKWMSEELARLTFE